ncbi:hypothetical protein F0562_023248 [Nyssa sinensis]|uniref:Uncharacterized protein n=1 Tax=Nyssa sinensis TaxID=561372 RepID=A0A5J5BHE2_9ASTE|nr:hypothetical protein F0562_023248 [Nyssa sinensis]
MEILQVGAEESEDKLYQQFKNLQRDWDTFKQSNPRTLRRCLTDSNTIIKTLQLLNNSPRDLMSSLQYRRSPSEAVEEILRERRAAIESGKLKGRRLFGGLEGATEMAFEGREEICNDCFDLVQESEVRSVSSYGSHAENVNCESKEEVPSGCCHCCSCSGSSLSGLISMRCNAGYEDEDEYTEVMDLIVNLKSKR